MKKSLTQQQQQKPIIDINKESEEKRDEEFLQARKRNIHDEDDDDDKLGGQTVHCITTLHSHTRRSNQPGEQISVGQYGRWREQQKSRVAVLEQQLQARCALEDTIDQQLKHFNTHYNRAMVPTQLEDVANILMPKWAPPLEIACVGWLGDWRPSAILELLRSLARSSCLSSSLADSTETDRILSQLIHDIRIEETVIDEEMAEIQATCILHLPFGPVHRISDSPLAMVQSELQKIKQVITKAQQLRYKALEVVVKKVLSQVDAAEFLVAFAGIQDLIHQFADQPKFKKSPVSVSVKALRSV